MSPARVALLVPVLLLLAPLGASGNTLSPGHPVWSTPGVDLASFREALRLGREAVPKPIDRGGLDGLGRGFAAHGRRVLVLPVLYAEDPAQPPLSRETLQSRCFGEATEGSVRGYYEYVSGGRFVLEGVVLDWQRLPGTLRDYHNVSDGVFRGLGGSAAMVRDALRLAATQIDLSWFDDDGPDGIAGSGDDDGKVDLLLLLHPDEGFELSLSTEGFAILAHQSRIPEDEELAEDGVVGDAYVLASALGPLGVWVHEMGHLLGLEDLYDVAETDSPLLQPNRGGLGLWSLMAHGTWGGEGHRPSDLDPVSRRLLGWEDSVDSRVGGDFLLEPVGATLRRSLTVLPFGPWTPERFVLEVRRARPEGVVDGGLPGSGMLVYRVDDRQRLNDSREDPWIELLQADGRHDLEEQLNNGDATDPFSSAFLLSEDSTPGTASQTPDPERVAPALDIAAPLADGSQVVGVALSSAPALRLSYALFEDLARGDRAHLLFGETSQWDLRFRDMGSPVSAARLRLSAEPPLEILSEQPVELVLSGSEWIPAAPVEIRWASELTPEEVPTVGLEIEVDGGLTRQLELGVPVSLLGGIEAVEFSAWTPQVLAAPADSTRFEALPLSELPLPTESGWALVTAGQEGHADGVELTLTSPWFAGERGDDLHLWSRGNTEASQPGEALDGGVVEIWRADVGWEALRPQGGPTVLIVHRSRAATRGLVGFGGEAVEWTAYRVELPALPSATRVRLRFAADESIHGDATWAVAGFGSEPVPGSATVTVSLDPDGRPVADARVVGDLPRVSSVRFRYRSPLETTWSVASSLLNFSPDLPTVFAILELPADVPFLEVGLFAESLGDAVPPLLLGSAGFRRPDAPRALLRAERNPSHGAVTLLLDPRDDPTPVTVYDLRGRRVRVFEIPAHRLRWEWDGRADGGGRVAAGRYFLTVGGDPEQRLSVVYFP